MEVRLLYFDGCPNWTVAEERLRSALVSLVQGDVPFQRIQV